MIIRSKVPLRLGLAGGGTDVSPFSDIYGGAILNATVNMYAYTTLEPLDNGQIVFENPAKEELGETLSATDVLTPEGYFILHKGVYNRIVKQFTHKPLSFKMSTFVDAPPGSGLGTSSTLVVYMTRMVNCVNETHGVVDKYIGDAIMAVWGAPDSAGSPAADALNAVTAALMMRVSLFRFNKDRKEKGLPPVRIGCGINSGPVVAGQIGSDQRMEYTVIGDAVNLASRTEALNKPFATDILITENTYNLIKDKVIVEEMPGVHVKGKSDEIKMFAVINLKGKIRPATISEVRKIIGTQAPDLSKVNTDDEEKKYKIQAQ